MAAPRAIGFSLCLALLSSLPAECAEKADKKVVAFFKAVNAGDLDGIQEAVKKKVDLNAFDENENTALGIAAAAGRPEVVKALLEAACDVNAAAENNRTPLVSALLKAGAEPSLKDNGGQTACQLAQESGHPSTAELLEPRPAPAKATAKPKRTRPAPKP